MGGRRVDKPKLNYRFHVTATPEKLIKELLLVCVEANKKKVEDGLKEEIKASSGGENDSNAIEVQRKK